MKHLVENDWVDRSFVDGHTTGYEELAAVVRATPWDELTAASGTTVDDMADLAQRLHEAERAVLVWSMGLTQHARGEDNVRAVLNLALSQGFVGKPGCGVVPIRGHSGVQGGAEMGAFSTNLPGGAAITPENVAALSDEWGFAVPDRVGWTAPELVDAAARGEVDVLISIGGNLLDVLPDPDHTRAALAAVPVRVFMDIVVTPQMLLDPADVVVLLPAMTRYEKPGGITETSTERRVIFSPTIPGPRVDEARAEWQVLPELAERARPELAGLVAFPDAQAVRDEIARIVPFYDGIQHLRAKGDAFQYGGRLLCEGWQFATADGLAHFSLVTPPRSVTVAGELVLSTRRGKQFNSMVHESVDPLNGTRRDSVLMAPADAEALGLANGDAVELVSTDGRLRSVVCLAPIRPGNVQVHWPEGNVLLGASVRSAEAGTPDYNARVRVERV